MCRRYIFNVAYWTVSIIALLFLVSIVTGKVHAETAFPDRGRAAVVDTASVFDDDTKNRLNTQLVAWHDQTKHTLVVVTIADLGDNSIKDYGYKLGRTWHLGQTGVDDAAILLYAVKQRAVRIEVGNGFEPVLTDAITSQILRDAVVPKMKSHDPQGALVSGATSIIDYVNSHPDQMMTRSSPTHQSNFSWIVIVGLIVSGFAFITAIILHRKMKKAERLAAKKTTTNNTNVNNDSPQSNYRTNSYYYDERVVPHTPRVFSSTTGHRYDSDTTSTAVAAAAIASAASDVDDSTRRSSYDTSSSSDYGDSGNSSSSDSGFSSDNSDSNNFSGGGSDTSW